MMKEVAMNASIVTATAVVVAAAVVTIVEVVQVVDLVKCLKLIMSFIASIAISHLATTEVVNSCSKMD